jgi:hypothetical protein
LPLVLNFPQAEHAMGAPPSPLAALASSCLSKPKKRYTSVMMGSRRTQPGLERPASFRPLMLPLGLLASCTATKTDIITCTQLPK